jgi:outer membrane receptor protein involved in Fe transport
MIDTAGRGAFTRADKGYVSATLERTASDRVAWVARGSWGRTHFTDYQRTGNDAAVANRFGAELRAVAHPADDRVVTIGGEGARSDVASNIFGEHSQSEVGAYGESEQRFGPARVTAGARIDYIAVDGGGLSAVVSPRVGAVLETGSGAWRVSAGRGFRAPSLAERFVATVVQGIRVIPNPNLAPETAWSFEVGTTTHPTPATRSDAALFWTEAYDLIEPTVSTGNTSIPQIQFKNVARARLLGLDLSFGARPLTPRLTTAVAYSLLYARELAHDSVPGRSLAFRPRHLVTLSADYQWHAVSVGGDYRYTSRFERVELYPGDPRIAGQVLDLRASLERGPVAIRCQVTNALNYIYNQVPRTLAPVRTLWVSATWTY